MNTEQTLRAALEAVLQYDRDNGECLHKEPHDIIVAALAASEQKPTGSIELSMQEARDAVLVEACRLAEKEANRLGFDSLFDVLRFAERYAKAQQAAPTPIASEEEEAINDFFTQVINHDFSGDNSDDLRLAVNARAAVFKLYEIAQQAAPEQATEPIAHVIGYYAGRCTIEPINRALVMPQNMALYAAPLPQQREDSDAADARRYRWLRNDTSWTVSCFNGIARFSASIPAPTHVFINDCENDLDVAIDAAIAREGKTT